MKHTIDNRGHFGVVCKGCETLVMPGASHTCENDDARIAELEAALNYRAEQAEAFHKERKRAEPDLQETAGVEKAEATIAELKKELTYYRDHYETVFKQRNEAETKVAKLLDECLADLARQVEEMT